MALSFFFFFFLSGLIHPGLRLIVAQMTLLDTLLFLIVHLVDKLGHWHKLPVFLGLGYLGIRRRLHQRYKLLNVGGSKNMDRRYNAEKTSYRTADGRSPTHAMIISAAKGHISAETCHHLVPSMRDGSVIYGNNAEGMRRVRTFIDGKLKILLR